MYQSQEVVVVARMRNKQTSSKLMNVKTVCLALVALLLLYGLTFEYYIAVSYHFGFPGAAMTTSMLNYATMSTAAAAGCGRRVNALTSSACLEMAEREEHQEKIRRELIDVALERSKRNPYYHLGGGSTRDYSGNFSRDDIFHDDSIFAGGSAMATTMMSNFTFSKPIPNASTPDPAWIDLLPRFNIFGLPKGGTSQLYGLLSEHEDVMKVSFPGHYSGPVNLIEDFDDNMLQG